MKRHAPLSPTNWSNNLCKFKSSVLKIAQIRKGDGCTSALRNLLHFLKVDLELLLSDLSVLYSHTYSVLVETAAENAEKEKTSEL